MEEHTDGKIVEDIKNSLNYLEIKTKVKQPDLTHFRNLVGREEEKKSRSKKRDSRLFTGGALALLAFEISILRLSAMLFLLFQGLVTVIVPAAAVAWYFYKRRRVNTA